MTWNRRQMLLAAGAALIAPGAMGRALAANNGSPKKVLFFTKSSGFQHSVIARKDGKLGLAERILTEIGKEHGFEVVASKDGRFFDPDKIGEWDAFAFETTGDLTHGRHRQDSRRCRPTARRPSSTRSAAARASSACTAPPTPSTAGVRRSTPTSR